MTYNPFDENQVKFNGGVLGQELNFAHSIPSGVSLSSTGSANAGSPDQLGISFGNSGTSGDTATIQPAFYEAQQYNKVVGYFIFRPSNTWGGIDDLEIGFGLSGVNDGTAAKLDLTDENVKVGSTTGSKNFSISGNDDHFLTIIMDFEASETTFKLRKGPGNFTEETISAMRGVTNDIAAYNSNGNGDEIFFRDYRVAVME